jgi:hypothetical protein
VATKLIEDVDGPAAFSPDGNRIAFVRRSADPLFSGPAAIALRCWKSSIRKGFAEA